MKKVITTFILIFIVLFLLCILYECMTTYHPVFGFDLSLIIKHFSTLYAAQYILYIISSLFGAWMLTYIYEVQNDWLKKNKWIRVKISEKKKGHSHYVNPRGSGSTTFYYTLIAYNETGDRLPLACSSLEYGLIEVGEVLEVAVRRNRILDFRPINEGE